MNTYTLFYKILENYPYIKQQTFSCYVKASDLETAVRNRNYRKITIDGYEYMYKLTEVKLED